MRATLFALVAAGCDCTVPPPDVADVGESCVPKDVPAGGFDGTETLVRREPECDDACVVHDHLGDLVPDEEETQASIDEEVFCTCSCGNIACGETSDIRCPVCPDGFECCTIGAPGECTIGMVSDWCLREGTCP
jgi:hypothetical protein